MVAGPPRREDSKYARQKWARGFNLPSFLYFLETLKKTRPGRGHTREELQELVGVSIVTVGKWLALIEGKYAYVVHWRKVEGFTGYIAEWTFGLNTENTLKPKPLSESEKCKLYRLRKRIANEERIGNLSR